MLKRKIKEDRKNTFAEYDDDEDVCVKLIKDYEIGKENTETDRCERNDLTDNAEEQWARKSARSRQMLYCRKLGDRIWNKYPNDDLKRIIAYALFGEPKIQTSKEDNDLLCGYSEKEKKDTLKLFNIIIKHVPPEEEIHISVIFVICETAKGERFDVPVFRIRKCIPKNEIEIDLCQKYTDIDLLTEYMDCCVILIDVEGRVYESWQDFLCGVRLPKCKMIVPHKGFYCQDSMGEVVLGEYTSPECSIGAKVKRVIYGTGTAASVTSTAVLAAAAVPAITIAPVVVTGAVVVGIGAGVTIATTGIMTIVDRVKHRQTVAPTNMESVNAYINIGGGLLGASQMAFARGLTKAAQEGVIIAEGVKTAYNVITGLNIAVNAVGVASIGYSGVNRWRTEKTVSQLEVFQFTTSLLFFTGTVVSLKSANTIITEAQASVSITSKTKEFFNNIVKTEKRGFTENVRDLFTISDNVFKRNTEQDKITSVSPLEYSRMDSFKDLFLSHVTVNALIDLNRIQNRLMQALKSQTFERIILNGLQPNMEDIKNMIAFMISPITNFIADIIVDIFIYIVKNIRKHPILDYIDRLYGSYTSVATVVLDFIRQFLLQTAGEIAKQSPENSPVKWLTKAVEMFCSNGSFSTSASRFIVKEFEEYLCTKMVKFLNEKEMLKNKYKKCEHCKNGYYRK